MDGVPDGSAVEVTVGTNQYSGLPVPERCTVGEFKALLASGAFGAKILYPNKLICRASPHGGPLEDTDRLPGRPGRVFIGGPHAVVKMLELALKPRLDKPARKQAAKLPEGGPLQSQQRPLATPARQTHVGQGSAEAGSDHRSPKGEALVLQVQCPEGVAPGEVVQVEDPRTGRVLPVAVPRGAGGGRPFELRLPTGDGPPVAVALGEGAGASSDRFTLAGNVLGSPLDQATIDKVLRRHPNFSGTLPQDVAFWSSAELEEFCGSPSGDEGRRGPPRPAAGGPTCPLLLRLRLALAECNIAEPTAEYASICKHLSASGFQRWTSADTDRRAMRPPRGLLQAPFLASAAPCVERVRSVPPGGVLSAPFVVSDCLLPAARGWDLQFWLDHAPHVGWLAAARTPLFPHDSDEGPEGIRAFTSVGEFIEYATLVDRVDPACQEENAIAFPRVCLEGWPAFSEALPGIFHECWKDLVVDGLEDLTPRWSQMFASRCHGDWMETLMRYYLVTLAAPGSSTRLRRESNGAHRWLFQTHGRRLVFLLPGEEKDRLCERRCFALDRRDAADAAADRRRAGGAGEAEVAVYRRVHSWAQAVSPVNLFAAGRDYAEARNASARSVILEPGETLVIPSGWWWCGLALEAGATLEHRFFGPSNSAGAAQDLVDCLEMVGAGLPATLLELRREIADDVEELALAAAGR